MGKSQTPSIKPQRSSKHQLGRGSVRGLLGWTTIKLPYRQLGLAINGELSPVLFDPERVGGIPFSVFIEGLEEKSGDVHPAGPGEEVAVVALLLLFRCARTELARNRGPTGFGNSQTDLWQRAANLLEIGNRIGHGLVNILAVPPRVRVDEDEIHFLRERRAVLRSPKVVARAVAVESQQEQRKWYWETLHYFGLVCLRVMSLAQSPRQISLWS